MHTACTPTTDLTRQTNRLRRHLERLAEAEHHYRETHKRYGHDSLAANQAWDRMRRAGFQARLCLREVNRLEAPS